MLHEQWPAQIAAADGADFFCCSHHCNGWQPRCLPLLRTRTQGALPSNPFLIQMGPTQARRALPISPTPWTTSRTRPTPCAAHSCGSPASLVSGWLMRPCLPTCVRMYATAWRAVLAAVVSEGGTDFGSPPFIVCLCPRLAGPFMPPGIRHVTLPVHGAQVGPR